MLQDSSHPQLVRAIGRWTLVGLVLNNVIGSGIFGLASAMASYLGSRAPLAYVCGALAIGIIMAVFAEVSSQYRESGGQYLYARDAFGRFAGVQIGWFFLLVRVTSGAAVLNLFVNYLAEFWPDATGLALRAAVMTVLVAGLTVVNYRGVRVGARVSNILTIAKLGSLGVFVVAGLVMVRQTVLSAPVETARADGWTDALVTTVFAFGGFESALIPAAEVKDPRRDMGFALGIALVVVAIFYLAIHLVAMWSVPDLAHSKRPLADAARSFAGSNGAAAMALIALVSVYGWDSGAFVAMPRLIYAMGERGDFPRITAKVHPRFRTPHVAISLWAVLILLLAISGSFMWNVILAGVARLVTYGATCAARIQLRRRNPDADAWRVPAGRLLAVLGLGFCVFLGLHMTSTQAVIMSGVMVIATVNWLVVRTRVPSRVTPVNSRLA